MPERHAARQFVPARQPPVSIGRALGIAFGRALGTAGNAAAAVFAAGLVFLAVPSSLDAQVTDTAATSRPGPSLIVPKPNGAAPLSPRRAFLYSLAAPGSAQSILGRPTAGAIFVAVESGSLAMIAKSINDLHAARAVAFDSVVYKYDTTGNGGIIPRPFRRPTAGALRAKSRIPARRAHVEDWITILIVNHFLAGADAYVAANLWDVPADVGISAAPAGGVIVAARIAW